jgi:DNA end-binding protein Ku
MPKAKVKSEEPKPTAKVQADGRSGTKTWSGQIVTGPIAIEVGMYVAASAQRISFNMLHARCSGQVKQLGYYCPCCTEVEVLEDFKYQSVPELAAHRAICTEMGFEDADDWPEEPDFIECKKGQVIVMHADDVTAAALQLPPKIKRTGKTVLVPGEEMTKGYEYTKGKFAVVTKAELDALKPASAKTLEISYFIDARELDPIYFEASYYLPPPEMTRAYAMLRKGMEATGKVAVGRICVRNSENTVFIKPHVLGGLVAYTSYMTDEVRQIAVTDEPELSPAEIAAVSAYIEANTEPLDLSKFKDAYRERVGQLIEAKKTGGTLAAIELPVPKPAETVDLVQAFALSAKMALEKKAAAKAAA